MGNKLQCKHNSRNNHERECQTEPPSGERFVHMAFKEAHLEIEIRKKNLAATSPSRRPYYEGRDGNIAVRN